VRWPATLDREAALGVEPTTPNAIDAVHVRIPGDQGLSFCGRISGSANATDFRLYIPQLIDAFEARGGKFVVESVTPTDLDRVAAVHDLVVVAVGRDGFGTVFGRDETRSPRSQPARHIAAGLYRGVGWPSPSGVEFTIIPGIGEIFQVCFQSFDGPVSAVAVEAIPEGPLDVLVDRDYAADPAGFHAAVLGLIETFAPALRGRIDGAAFALERPQDLLQGRLVPTVRHAYAALGDARVIAIGDAWILNDPIAAQGANLGSRCAFIVGEAIVTGGPYDDAFCRSLADRMWEAAAAPTILSNALLDPPPEHVVSTLVRATADQALADRFVNGFGSPEDMLRLLAPEPVG